MTSRHALLLLGLFVLGAGALLAGADRAVEAPKPTTAAAPRVPLRPVELPGEATFHEREAFPSGAVSSLALDAVARARTSTDKATLEEELLALGTAPPRGSELMALRGRLERLLRERPELAPAVARAFLALEDRGTLFVLSRALLISPGTRDTLVLAARAGQLDARREVALIALAGSGEVALARAAFDEGSPNVRAAGAYALSREPLDPAVSAAVRSAARGLAAATREDAHLRAEALHLIAGSPERSGADRALARAVLAEPGAPAEVALAAARLAVLAGEDKTSVARALGAQEGEACALAARTLRATGSEREGNIDDHQQQ